MWVPKFPRNLFDLHCLLPPYLAGCLTNIVGQKPLAIFLYWSFSVSCNDNNNNDNNNENNNKNTPFFISIMLFLVILVMLMNPYVLSLSSCLFHAQQLILWKIILPMFYLKFYSSSLQNVQARLGATCIGRPKFIEGPKISAHWQR